MKKILSLLLAVIVIAALSACDETVSSGITSLPFGSKPSSENSAASGALSQQSNSTDSAIDYDFGGTYKVATLQQLRKLKNYLEDKTNDISTMIVVNKGISVHEDTSIETLGAFNEMTIDSKMSNLNGLKYSIVTKNSEDSAKTTPDSSIYYANGQRITATYNSSTDSYNTEYYSTTDTSEFERLSLLLTSTVNSDSASSLTSAIQYVLDEKMSDEHILICESSGILKIKIIYDEEYYKTVLISSMAATQASGTSANIEDLFKLNQIEGDLIFCLNSSYNVTAYKFDIYTNVTLTPNSSYSSTMISDNFCYVVPYVGEVAIPQEISNAISQNSQSSAYGGTGLNPSYNYSKAYDTTTSIYRRYSSSPSYSKANSAANPSATAPVSYPFFID